jgi:hypothetical protein
MNLRGDFTDQLEDYLDNAEGSTVLPETVRNTIRAKLPRTRQLEPLWGPMRFLPMAMHIPRSTRYGLAGVVVAIALLGGAGLLVGTNHPSSSPTPMPSASPAASGATVVLDALVAAWNDGAGQRAASLYVPQPAVHFMINGSDIVSYSTSGEVATAMTAWHSQGTVLSRTTQVLTQGPYAASAVTWTSSQGTFNGALVVHLSSEGLVEAEYLIGATPTAAPGAARGTTVVTNLQRAIYTPVRPIVLRLGAATPGAFAVDARAWQWEGDAMVGQSPVDGRSGIAGLLGVDQPAESYADVVEVQGPFVLYSTSGGDEGFNLLWLTGDGLVQYSWSIRVPTNSPAPAASGG